METEGNDKINPLEPSPKTSSNSSASGLFWSSTALLVVDMQNDFVEGGALPVKGGKKLVSLINHLISLFPLVIGTKDWHPQNHGSFYCQYPGAKPYQMGELGGRPQVLWPVHCVQGSEGAKFIEGLDIGKMAAVFTKGKDPQVDSYSALYDNNHQNPTGLGDYLHKCGVRTLFICGLALDYCVRYSAEDALKIIDEVYVIKDATAAVNPSEKSEIYQIFQEKGIKLVSSDQVSMLFQKLVPDGPAI